MFQRERVCHGLDRHRTGGGDNALFGLPPEGTLAVVSKPQIGILEPCPVQLLLGGERRVGTAAEWRYGRPTLLDAAPES
jgi:hypothetical protein